MRSCIVFVAILAVACAAPTENDGILSSALQFVKECGDRSMSLCVKERALRYVDQTNGDIELGDGVKFVQTEQAAQGRSLNEIDLPVESEARENEIDSLLVDRVARFMGTHTLQFKIPKDSIQDMQRSVEEGRKKGKKLKKLLGPLLLLGKLKAAILLKVAIAVLALIAFKALIIGKLALLISGFLALKKLLGSKGGSSQTYEVVAHPHEEHHDHYGRSFNAQNLAYSAHA